MKRQLPFAEFVALIALLFSLIAYGTDAMLPALGLIAGDLGLTDPNRAQLVVSAFIIGTGLGQLVAGPLSDAIGRKPVLLSGIAIFILASLATYWVDALIPLLILRFVQGLGVAAPRSTGQAMVRDLYSGRMMARVVSLAMMLFVLVPAVAPFAGQIIMNTAGWRAIFGSFAIFGLVAALWMWLRQGETLSPEHRRPFKAATILSAAAEVFSNRRALVSMIVLTLAYAMIFSYLSTAQQAFVHWLGVGERFPAYFALIALISGGASALNAWLVVRFGMWLLSTLALVLLCILSLGTLALLTTSLAPLPIFLGWSIAMFVLATIVFSNINAFAMEPLGHLAGTAAAIIGAVTTLLSIAIAAPLGLAFDGTGIPLIAGIAACAGVGIIANLFNPRQVEETN